MFTTITQSLKLNFVFTMDSDTNIAPMNPLIDSPSINSKNSENELNNYNFEVLHVNFEKLSNSFTEKYSKAKDINSIRIKDKETFYRLSQELITHFRIIKIIKPSFFKGVINTMRKNNSNYTIVCKILKTNKCLFGEIEKRIDEFLLNVLTPFHVVNDLEKDEIHKTISTIKFFLLKMTKINRKMISIKTMIFTQEPENKPLSDIWSSFYRNIENIFLILKKIESLVIYNVEKITFKE